MQQTTLPATSLVQLGIKDNIVVAVVGEPIEILVSSKFTHYTCWVASQASPPGGGPKLHKHRRDEEMFVVIEGEYKFFDGRDWVLGLSVNRNACDHAGTPQRLGVSSSTPNGRR